MNRVLITGAARGIGLATARAFAEAGWEVISLDNDFAGEVVGERLEFDLRRLDEIPSLIAGLNKLDALVNNAAVLYCDPVDRIPKEHTSEILAVNLEAPAALIAAAAPGMRERRSGRIVNVSSVAAFTGHPDLWYGVFQRQIAESDEMLGAGVGPAWRAGERGGAGADEDAHVRSVAAIAPG